MKCPECGGILTAFGQSHDINKVRYRTCPSCGHLVKDTNGPDIRIQEALEPYLGKEVESGLKFLGTPIKELNCVTLCKIINYMAEEVRRIEDDQHRKSLDDMAKAVEAAKEN